jgi:DNA-binding protein HU-beta
MEIKVNKHEVAVDLAKRLDITQKEATAAVDGLLAVLKDALLVEHKTIILRGFGAFEVVTSAPRTGRNIRTNEPIAIPARKRIRFDPYISPEETAQ